MSTQLRNASEVINAQNKLMKSLNINFNSDTRKRVIFNEDTVTYDKLTWNLELDGEKIRMDYVYDTGCVYVH